MNPIQHTAEASARDQQQLMKMIKRYASHPDMTPKQRKKLTATLHAAVADIALIFAR